uniref:L1 transposable element RRM domain-containing protein n=1 Tax=Sus scrofa TaxID=9823 RepID=A0A4X1U9I8_PIG
MLCSCGTADQHCQPPRRAPQPSNTRASSYQLRDICFHHSADLPVLSVLRKSSFALERPCQSCPTPRKATLPQRRPTNNTSPGETFHNSAKANPAWPQGVQLHQEKENNKQDEEAEKPPQLNQREISPKAVNNETDLCSLTDLEFKREIMKILKELREDMNSNADALRKELENVRRSQEKLENSFAEMQTELKAVKTRMNNAEERISDVEDRIMEITQIGQQMENQMKKHESNIRDLWNNIKWVNLRIIGIPEGVEKDKGMESIFEEIITGNFPNLKDTDFKMQEAQRAPNKLNPNRPTPRHIIIKMAKVNDKERILKAAREKQNVTYKGTPIR